MTEKQQPGGSTVVLQPGASWRDLLMYLKSSPVFNLMLEPLLRSRADIMARAGTTFGGERKHYEIFGWPLSPDVATYKHLYQRGGIARRVVVAYPQATWRTPPVVMEAEEMEGNGEGGTSETPFELDWKELISGRKVFHYLERVDRMARLGKFAILFLGYNDGSRSYEDLANPVQALKGSTPKERLLYLQPYDESRVKIKTYEDDTQNERFGLPKLYAVDLTQIAKGTRQTVAIHWTRVLHVAEDVLESDLEGTPCLEPVLNYILDMEKVLGSSAESFFQQTPPYTLFKTAKDATVDETTLTDTRMDQNIADFVHGLKRYLVLQNFDMDQLTTQIGDPSKNVASLLDLIAGTTGIPKRILIGSERGELSSEQDETNWNKRVEERQSNWADPFVVFPFVAEMIGKGVIRPPKKGGFKSEWQEARALSEQVLAEISDKRSGALQKYANSPDAQGIIPPEIFLREVMGFSQTVIDEIKDLVEEIWEKELDDLLKEPEEFGLPGEGEFPPPGGKTPIPPKGKLPAPGGTA